jgi:hypothetical protein
MNGGGLSLASLEHRIAAVMRAVQAYLEAHPHAGDTRRGVEFWLRDLPETPSQEIVETALARLVERGDVEMRRIAGTVVFGSAKRSQKKK